MDKITASIPKLSSLWTSLKPKDVVDFDLKQLIALKNIFYNSEKPASICGAKSLRKLLESECNWSNINNCIDSGYLETLCISTTCAHTGKTKIFAQSSLPIPSHKLFRSEIISSEIGVEHALASASIPVIFPPVQIDGGWFTDGGVRQNTPIEPALAFGATHVFTIGMWHDGAAKTSEPANPPSIGHLIGKIFNSFFIDHAKSDFYNLNKYNDLIDKIAKNHSIPVESLMTEGFNIINSCVLNPSRDIGNVAAEYLNKSESLKKDKFFKKIIKSIDIGSDEADLASYLLFDGEFSRILIDLGFEDAKRNLSQLKSFFGIKDVI